MNQTMIEVQKLTFQRDADTKNDMRDYHED